jgi:hypothetical protein
MKKLLLGILLCTAAFLAPGLWILSLVNAYEDRAVSFRAPGEMEVRVEEPARYFLWNDYRTIFEGRTYANEKNLPDGVEFVLEDVETGGGLPLRSDAKISVSTDGSQRTALGYFLIDEPGVYRLTIRGLDRPRIFSFGPSPLGDIGGLLGSLFFLLVLAAAAMIGGIFLIVFGLIAIFRTDSGRTAPPG